MGAGASHAWRLRAKRELRNKWEGNLRSAGFDVTRGDGYTLKIALGAGPGAELEFRDLGASNGEVWVLAYGRTEPLAEWEVRYSSAEFIRELRAAREAAATRQIIVEVDP